MSSRPTRCESEEASTAGATKRPRQRAPDGTVQRSRAALAEKEPVNSNEAVKGYCEDHLLSHGAFSVTPRTFAPDTGPLERRRWWWCNQTDSNCDLRTEIFLIRLLSLSALEINEGAVA